MKVAGRRDLLLDYLTLYFDSPGLGLYRALEARLFAGLDYQEPILDLGCGDGSFTSVLFPPGTPGGLYGLDLSLECLRQAREAAGYDRLVQGDIQILGFRDGAFRTVFSNCVLEHVPDIEAAIREIARVTRPGGFLYFTVPSERYGDDLLFYRLLSRLGRGAWARRYIEAVTERLNHYRYDSPATWEARLAGSGFDVVRIAYYSAPAAHRVYDLLFNSVGIGRFRIVAAYYKLAHLVDRLGLGFLKSALVSFFRFVLKRRYASDETTARKGGGGLFIVARKK